MTSPLFKDYYFILGISSHATADEIKTAYRRLALEYHPDKNHDNPDDTQFKIVVKAYEALSDAHKKQEYDSTYISNQAHPPNKPSRASQQEATDKPDMSKKWRDDYCFFDLWEEDEPVNRYRAPFFPWTPNSLNHREEEGGLLRHARPKEGVITLVMKSSDLKRLLKFEYMKGYTNKLKF